MCAAPGNCARLRGKMIRLTCAWLFRTPLISSTNQFCWQSCNGKIVWRISSAAILLILLSLTPKGLLGQQGMPQYPSQSPYAGQYPVEQQPAYGSQQSYPPPKYAKRKDLPAAALQSPPQNYQPAGALNTEQLEQLVAPIALYP